MWYLVACRACLTTEGKLEKFTPVSKRMFTAITGLEVADADGSPTHLCGECYTLIKKAMAFRRRSRRAHYVLKEISIVKKQVTQKDIQLLDRKKTNLITHYSYWNPENSVAYSISTPDVDITDENLDVNDETQTAETVNGGEVNKNNAGDNVVDTENENRAKAYSKEIKQLINVDTQTKIEMEGNEEPSELKLEKCSEMFNTKGSIIKHSLNTINSSTVLVDIKPANYKEIERLEEEERKRQRDMQIEAMMKEIRDDEFQNDDYVDDCVKEEEIDLEDVFKGLKEAESEDDELPDLLEPIEETKKKLVPRVKWAVGAKCRRAAHSLAHCTIRLMSLEEQRAAFQKRMLEEPFRSAHYKCLICMSVNDSLNDLLEHVGKHNKKRQYEFKCTICKDQFKSEKKLNRHSAEKHWYEYSCAVCKGKHYKLSELTSCHAKCLLIKKPRAILSYEQMFTKRALPPELYRSTLLQQRRGSIVCHTCLAVFQTVSALNKHQEKHQLNPKWKVHHLCDICGIYFQHKSAMENHMAHNHLYSYVCNECGTCVLSRHFAMLHWTQHPGKGKMFPCSHCDKVFPSVTKLTYHENRGHQVECNACGHTSTSLQTLYTHQLTTHGYVTLSTEPAQNDPRYLCSHCNVYFANEKAYFKHLVRAGHEEAKDYPRGCTTCRTLFASEEELARHRLDCRSTVFPQKCVYCDVTLGDSSQYVSHHYKQHQQLPYPRLASTDLCHVCGRTVHHKKFLEHLRSHESSSDELKCRYCACASLTACHHIAHVLFNHTLKPYCCTLCGTRFMNRCECRDHILKTHAPVRPYECSVCARTFSHVDYLRDHCLKLHHIDLKKTDRSLFLARKNIGTLLVYPHMKIDGSLLQVDVLKKVKIEACDYLDQNRKQVDYSECFFFDPTVDPSIPTRQLLPKRNSGQKSNLPKGKKRNSVEIKEIVEDFNFEDTKKGKIIKIESEEIIKEEDFNWQLLPKRNQPQKSILPKGKKRSHLEIVNQEHFNFEDTDKKGKRLKIEAQETIKRDDFHFKEEKKDKKRKIKTDVEILKLQDYNFNRDMPSLLEEPIDSEIKVELAEDKQIETEDVIGELVEQDGEYYALVNGVLYKIEDSVVE